MHSRNLGNLFVCIVFYSAMILNVGFAIPAFAQVVAEKSDEQNVEQKVEKKEDAKVEFEKILKPFLWEIKAGAKKNYLFGTIHVSDERIIEMHPASRKAFRNSDRLFVELTPQDAPKQMAEMTLPFKAKLEDELDPKTIERLDKQLKDINPIYSTKLLKFKTFAWPLILPSLEVQSKNAEQVFLDFKLVEDAMASGKSVSGLEQAGKQLAGLAALSQNEQVDFLKATLAQMEEEDRGESDSLKELLNLYLAGETEPLQKMLEEEFSEDDSLAPELGEKIRKALMDDRNVRMVESIKSALKDFPDKSHFFAAGTAHFLGKNSVIELLEKEGFKITRITGQDNSESTGSNDSNSDK